MILTQKRKPYRLYSELDKDNNLKGYYFLKKNLDDGVYRPSKKDALAELKHAKRLRL